MSRLTGTSPDGQVETGREQGLLARHTHVLAKVHPCFGEMGGCMVAFRKGAVVSAQQTEEAWQLRAACRGPQAAVFFPPATFERKDQKAERERRAKDICRTCPVRQPCLDYAVKIKEPHGIWGGLNESERKQLVLRRAH